MGSDFEKLNQSIEAENPLIQKLLQQMQRRVIGQHEMVRKLLVGILSGGHILLEGLPGLAKTLTVKTLADIIQVKFQRIQFTPDMLPADILGTMIYHQKEERFVTEKGPIFANIILADEINRAPAKVQSALLEAMQEKQVTISKETYHLAEPFLVLATQNPIEQEGTYPLPEAQVDRFMLKLQIGYPSREEEAAIIDLYARDEEPPVERLLSPENIFAMRRLVRDIYIDQKIKDYVLDLVFATRFPERFGLQEIQPLISYGASPRASLALLRSAKAHAFLEGRGFVIPDDIKALGPDVFRHRIILSYQAEAEEISRESLIQRIFQTVKAP